MSPVLATEYMHAIAHATRDQDGQMEYIAAVQDVTARKLAEEARDKARADLGRVAGVMSLGTLAASIAHELNKPLSGNVTNASTCLRMLPLSLQMWTGHAKPHDGRFATVIVRPRWSRDCAPSLAKRTPRLNQ